VGRAVAPAASVLRSETAGEESPSRTGQWVPAFGGVLTVVANGHRGQSQGKCHRKYTAYGSAPMLYYKSKNGDGNRQW
jgi:hypothetical protein